MSATDHLTAPVRDELEAFKGYFRTAMKADVGLVDKITRYILRQKGKQLRPLLVLLSAGVAGGISERTYRGAALVELLHTATLVHDDVVDDAETRRGMASVKALWGNKVGVLMGDYLLSRGLLLALKYRDHAALDIVSEAVRRMSEGELLQIEKARRLDIDEATYFRIISDKTASLTSACCEIGAASATDDPAVRATLRSVGEDLGIAFQIQDDLLDYMGVAQTIGKPTGTDLKEQKMTLPLIRSLNQAESDEARAIIRIVKNGERAGAAEVAEVMGFVGRHGGVPYAKETARLYADRARAAVETFADSPVRAALIGVIEYTLSRDK